MKISSSSYVFRDGTNHGGGHGRKSAARTSIYGIRPMGWPSAEAPKMCRAAVTHCNRTQLNYLNAGLASLT